ncbi:MAG: hypothetical protein J5I47_01420, partial [Vicingus serpentipes]|nr:hypothetical protein [Vicingus serpentipes]
MYRYIISLFILLFISTSLFSQGAGIRYVTSVPTTHPNTSIRQSVVVYNTTDGKYYQYQDSLW